MKVKMTVTKRRHGKAGDIIKVDQALGSALIASGVATPVEAESVAADAPSSVVRKQRKRKGRANNAPDERSDPEGK